LYTFDVDLSVKSDDGKGEGDAGTAPFPMFGLAYNAVTIFTESNDSDDEFDYEYDGILLYLSWNH